HRAMAYPKIRPSFECSSRAMVGRQCRIDQRKSRSAGWLLPCQTTGPASRRKEPAAASPAHRGADPELGRPGTSPDEQVAGRSFRADYQRTGRNMAGRRSCTPGWASRLSRQLFSGEVVGREAERKVRTEPSGVEYSFHPCLDRRVPCGKGALADYQL